MNEFEEKSMNPTQIQNMFNIIAKDYDLMNSIITFGMNSLIKNDAISKIPLKEDCKVLDLCCGTGDIAIQIARRYKNSKVVGIDFSANMIAIAKNKTANYNNIELLQGDVLNLDFEDNMFDLCIISFGLRNVANIPLCVSEMTRVTKENGYICNLDLGKPNKIFNILFKPYFNYVVPFLGKMFHGDSQPYKYLPESGQTFPSQEELLEIFKNAGCKKAWNYNLLFGSIAQQIGEI